MEIAVKKGVRGMSEEVLRLVLVLGQFGMLLFPQAGGRTILMAQRRGLFVAKRTATSILDVEVETICLATRRPARGIQGPRMCL